MTRNEFVELINLLSLQMAAEDSFRQGMKTLFPDCIPPIMNDGNLWEAVKHLLKCTIDKDEFVYWWIFESAMSDKSYVKVNGKEYRFKDAGELYDFMDKYYKNEL